MQKRAESHLKPLLGDLGRVARVGQAGRVAALLPPHGDNLHAEAVLCDPCGGLRDVAEAYQAHPSISALKRSAHGMRTYKAHGFAVQLSHDKLVPHPCLTIALYTGDLLLKVQCGTHSILCE